MAVVRALAQAAFPAQMLALEPRLLEKCAIPGRISGTAAEIWGAVLQRPAAAGAEIAGRVRAARHLHSWERHVVSDGLWALVRHYLILRGVVSAAAPYTDWLAWLVTQGLPPAFASEMAPQVDFQPLLAGAEGFAAIFEALPQRAAVALAAGVSEEAARALIESLGSDLPAFLAASFQRGPVTLRVDPTKLSAAAARSQLADVGIVTEHGVFSEFALRVTGRAQVIDTPLYRRGALELQDEGSQLVVDVLGARPGERIIDACAGAGGKTLALAAAMGGRGQLVALDVREDALDALMARARRGGWANFVDPHLWPQAWKPSQRMSADRVLVDAPCTGSGTWRRQPELRWRLSEEWIQSQVALQADILRRAAELVRVGGVLVYATCSVLREEDEAQIERFLAENPDFELDDLGALYPTLPTRGPFLRTSPQGQDTDGFFAARLRRVRGR